MSDTMESLVAYCRENRRVCPQPDFWNQLYEMLPNTIQKASGGWNPPLPLILAAWHETSAMSKMMRLSKHIEWASQHDALVVVSGFLRGLREEDWHHLG